MTVQKNVLHWIKTSGYAISSLSALMLAAVSWHSASKDPVLKWVLIVGVVASVFGMACRWFTYQVEQDEQA